MNNQYTCAVCGETFDSGWSDEEAKAELEEDFPDHDITECAIVCDGCYKRLGFDQ